MSPRQLLDCGRAEPLKVGVHVALGVLAVTCAIYNAAAWGVRRERHLAWNTVLYSAVVGYELMNVARHCRACRGGHRLTGGASPPHRSRM